MTKSVTGSLGQTIPRSFTTFRISPTKSKSAFEPEGAPIAPSPCKQPRLPISRFLESSCLSARVLSCLVYPPKRLLTPSTVEYLLGSWRTYRICLTADGIDRDRVHMQIAALSRRLDSIASSSLIGTAYNATAQEAWRSGTQTAKSKWMLVRNNDPFFAHEFPRSSLPP